VSFKSKTIIFIASTIMLAPQVFSDTKIESELGLATSYYRYQEPNLMSLRAINIGANYIGTLVFQNDWFIRTDLAATVSGGVHYSSNGTGSSDGQKNWYTDIRALVGKNLAFGNYALAPYVGFGYRYLYNDGRGITSTGNPGYRRASNYYYLPIGITHKLDLTGQSKLVTNLEFDYFLRGKQTSYLSDVPLSLHSPKYPGVYVIGTDFTNTQKSGYGARFSTMYQIDNLSVGPYLNYWHINTSDIAFLPTTKMLWYAGFCEPKNNTIEAGLKISVLF
jgi:hypothetical protein